MGDGENIGIRWEIKRIQGEVGRWRKNGYYPGPSWFPF